MTYTAYGEVHVGHVETVPPIVREPSKSYDRLRT